MINTDDFISEIKHAKCQNDQVESSSEVAILLDDEDGLSIALEFSNSMVCKVDYFLRDSNHNIQLIELTDLEDIINKNKILIDSKIDALKTKLQKEGSKKKITSSERKEIRRNVWAPVVEEFKRKWAGSIAVVERLYRKENIIDENPKYMLLIVCKDKTESRILDVLKQRLVGMISDIKVCNTKDLSEFLVTV